MSSDVPVATPKDEEKLEIPVQALSFQWLDLQKVSKSVGTDLSQIALGSVAQQIVDGYNVVALKQAEKKFAQKRKQAKTTANAESKLPDVGYKLQVSPQDHLGDYQLRVYCSSSTWTSTLAKGVQIDPLRTVAGSFLLFFFKEGAVRRIVVATSGQAWSVVRKYVNFEFPLKVIEKVGDPLHITKVVRRCLFGNHTKETLLHPDSFEFYKTKSLYYLVESFVCGSKANSSLSQLLIGPRTIHVTLGGLLRIATKVPLEKYPLLLNLFAQCIEGEVTYDADGIEEVSDPLFEFLHFLQPAQTDWASLTRRLVEQIYLCQANGRKIQAFVRYKHLEDFLAATNFKLKVNGKFEPCGDRCPEIDWIVAAIIARNNNVVLTSATFITAVLRCKLSFVDRTGAEQKDLLVNFLEGEVLLPSGETYFRVGALWYQLEADYLVLLHEDLKNMLKDALIPPHAEGSLPRPWKGNTKGGHFTQKAIPADLKAKPKGKGKGAKKQTAMPKVKGKGVVRSLMAQLAECKVSYVEGEVVKQKELVGEVLKNELIQKHRSAIEKCLSDEKFSGDLIVATCAPDGAAVLEVLREERKVLREVGKSIKQLFVVNPFPYPLREFLSDDDYEQLTGSLVSLSNKFDAGAEDEEAYNRSYLLSPYGIAQGYLVFDQICPDKIEPCDILRWTEHAVYLYHVKEKLGQHTRDACSQICNAAKMIRSALSGRQPENYLQKLWYQATHPGEESTWLQSVKDQLEKVGENQFFSLFRNKRIVFVYAFLPKRHSLFKEVTRKSYLSASDFEPGLFSELVQKKYLDSSGRLTGKFHSVSQKQFKISGFDSEQAFQQLTLFRSMSKSTLAKIELLQLAQSLRALNFEFKIVEIPRSEMAVAFDPSVSTTSITVHLGPSVSPVFADDDSSDVDDDDFDEPMSASKPLCVTLAKVEGGPIGYANIGNMCYVNASLQLLFNVPELREIVNATKDTNSFTKSLWNLSQEVDSSKTGSLLSAFRDQLVENKFCASSEKMHQHDAVDFILFTLGHVLWPRVTVTKTFTVPGIVTSKDEPMLPFLMDLGPATFQDVIHAFFAERECEDKMGYKVNVGGQECVFLTWKEQIRMLDVPEFLFVQLRRFKADFTKDSVSLVSFPLDGIVQIGSEKYEIVGYLNHMGRVAMKGHYTADVKNFREGSFKGQWFRCDDSFITQDTPCYPDTNAVFVLLKKMA